MGIRTALMMCGGTFAAVLVVAAVHDLHTTGSAPTSKTVAGHDAGTPFAAIEPAPAAATRTAVPARKATTLRQEVPAPCAHNHARQCVDVSLRAQRVWLCHRGDVVREFPVTTGRTDGHEDATPTGRCRIQGRNRDSYLDPGTGTQYEVRYWIPFDAPNYGFHDASWQHAGYGDTGYNRRHGSHGCVHMPLSAIHFLYTWVHMGTRVVITRS